VKAAVSLWRRTVRPPTVMAQGRGWRGPWPQCLIGASSIVVAEAETADGLSLANGV
jgi:hypothetical protein